jgi:hypothetical protein
MINLYRRISTFMHAIINYVVKRNLSGHAHIIDTYLKSHTVDGTVILINPLHYEKIRSKNVILHDFIGIKRMNPRDILNIL